MAEVQDFFGISPMTVLQCELEMNVRALLVAMVLQITIILKLVSDNFIVTDFKVTHDFKPFRDLTCDCSLMQIKDECMCSFGGNRLPNHNDFDAQLDLNFMLDATNRSPFS